jgi:hypothetical protein
MVKMGMAPLIIAGAAAAYSAYSQVQAGKASADYLNYLASQSSEMAKLQRKTGELNAGFIQESGVEQLHKFKQKAKQFQATQEATMAASGVQGVTAEHIALSTINQIAEDERAIMHNADVEIFKAKYGANMSASQSEQLAGQYGMQAGSARRIGNMKAFGSLLGGTADTWMMANKYSYMKKHPTYNSYLLE